MKIAHVDIRISHVDMRIAHVDMRIPRVDTRNPNVDMSNLHVDMRNLHAITVTLTRYFLYVLSSHSVILAVITSVKQLLRVDS